MWIYDKKLQYPVKIQRVDPALAKLIITQFGGPDGELGASQRYLSQRYAMPYDEVKAILTDIGTEELAHMEMICAIVHQLTRNLTEDQVKQGGFEAYFVDHTTGLYPVDATGNPWTAAYIQSKGDPICDLTEDLAAERGAHRKIMRYFKFSLRPVKLATCRQAEGGIFFLLRKTDQFPEYSV